MIVFPVERKHHAFRIEFTHEVFEGMIGTGGDHGSGVQTFEFAAEGRLEILFEELKHGFGRACDINKTSCRVYGDSGHGRAGFHFYKEAAFAKLTELAFPVF